MQELFANGFGDWVTRSFGMMIVVIVFYVWLARKYLGNNPDVKGAAKKAVAGKVIGIIGRLFK
jgi:hypothetical protein